MALSDKDVEKIIEGQLTGKTRFLPKKAAKAMSKKTKAKRTEESGDHNKMPKLDLRKIKPLTDSQYDAFEAFERGQNLNMQGCAGTGKSFIAMYLAFDALKQNKFKKLAIFRSVVPSRDVGFLPGSLEEKAKMYEIPYRAITQELYGRPDAYDIMVKKGVIEFVTTSYLRGTTFRNTIMFLDEVENCSFQECDTVLTRAGEGSRVIIAGDYYQSDLMREKEKEGLAKFTAILNAMGEEFKFIGFTKQDIVRAGLVKNYIIAREEYMRMHG